jgi:hypothetical protein
MNRVEFSGRVNEELSYRALMLSQTDPLVACDICTKITHSPTLEITMAEVVSFALKKFKNDKGIIEGLCKYAQNFSDPKIRGKVFAKLYDSMVVIDPKTANVIANECNRESEEWKLKSSQEICRKIIQLAKEKDFAAMIELSGGIEEANYRIWAYCEIASMIPLDYKPTEQQAEKSRSSMQSLLSRSTKDARIDESAIIEKDMLSKKLTAKAASLGLHDMVRIPAGRVFNRGIRENGIERAAGIAAITSPEASRDLGKFLTIPFRVERQERFLQLIEQARSERKNPLPMPANWKEVAKL